MTLSAFNRAWPVISGIAFLLTLTASAATAQTTLALPDTSQTSTITATVAEQARVTVPTGITFTVADTATATTSPSVAVSLANIVMATASKQLRVSLQADASDFTPPASGAATWAASQVSWNAASWTSASGSSGTLSASSYNAVATCTADSGSCSTSGLVFTLAPNTNVRRAGSHSLVVRWRVEATGN